MKHSLLLTSYFFNFPLSAARRTTHKKEDLHFHSCVGSDISDHDLEGIRKMAAYELKSGITAICPATINPARELGIEKAHGQITEGALSNLLILDQDLNIKDIIFKGQVLSL